MTHPPMTIEQKVEVGEEMNRKASSQYPTTSEPRGALPANDRVCGPQWQFMLRRWRALSGLSLSEAARRIGCSKAHLHDLEAGRSANPSIVLMRGISRTYGRAVTEVTFYAAGFGEPFAPAKVEGRS